ncbi:MAG: hypothetical protein HN542_09325 [Flavobacteriales bacterium]|jgi:hypothetical protein|nr:hypothetical protein [Flavobacteriales bacterium]NCG29879.1 hypothetical protein [Bacteroidota bacterium]MBT4704983.1 hypothetical protein [Flavobacteriales bacterium]MBT6133409.1 hypothetical protein [Flavobacteriales bacterium]MBT6916961.1 hypothetical protein [Flavobacteriales bacterium]
MQVDGLLISIPWIAAMLFLLFRFFPSISRTQIIVLFSIKVVFTFLLQAVYTYHFDDRSTADIYRFFDDEIILNQVFGENPSLFMKIILGVDGGADAQSVFEKMNSWIKPFDSGFYNDNHIMIKINALIGFMSLRYYEVHGLIFSFLSFTGLILLVNSLLKEKDRKIGYWLVVLFPSSLIWLSGGLKESLLIFGLGFTLYGLFENLSAAKKISLIACGVILLGSVKLYFLLALVPALVIWFAQSKKRMGWIGQLALWSGIAVAGYAALRLLNIDVVEYVVRKQHEFLNHSAVINPGSAFEMDYLEFSLTSLLSNIPSALMNGLIRPFAWEWNGVEWPKDS